MFQNPRLRLRTILFYTVGILIGAALLTLLINWLVGRAFLQNTQATLQTEAALIVANPAFVEAFEAGDAETIHTLLADWVTATSGTISAIDTAGNLLATSEPDFSPTLAQPSPPPFVNETGEPLVTVAAPVLSGDETLGFVRWTLPVEGYTARLRALQWQIAAAIFASALLAILLLYLEVERSARIIRRVTTRLERAAAQDFDGHILSVTPGELGDLAAATNRLVDKYRKSSKRRARDKDRLNTVLTQMSAGALILDEYGQVRLINPAGAALLRTTPERALRQSFVLVAWDHRIADVLKRSEQSGREESETIDLGRDRFYRVTVTPFLSRDANGHLVLLHDLSSVRHLEKVRRDFVSNVSHELRTPLASLTALVETLRDGAMEDPPAAQRFLNSMQLEVDKMTQMVEELLELSRVETGQIPLQRQESTVVMLVQPAIDRLRAQAERAGVTLASDLPNDLPTVNVDTERVQQVLINLIQNAIKFTPEGGSVTVDAWIGRLSSESRAEPQSTTSAEADEAEAVQDTTPAFVTLCVRDTGIGIAAADQPRIFERFYKTDRSRATGGTGLGLAIAKHTVQVHGGDIWVESREGHGSSFYFTLPANFPDIPSAIRPAETDARTTIEEAHDEDSD